MKRTELINVKLSSRVKLTPQGKIYKVIMSQYNEYSPALLDIASGKIKELSCFTSVYIVSEG
jgi:hypothetical protein